MTNDAIDRAIKRGTGEDGAEPYEVDHVRGLRPWRRGAPDRRAHRQPQPDRAPRSAASSPRWVDRWRSRVPSDGSSAAAGPDGGGRRRRGRVDDGRLDAGADDVADDGERGGSCHEPSVAFDVKDALEAAGLAIDSADTPMMSDN